MTLRRIFATFASITAPLFVFAREIEDIITDVRDIIDLVVVLVIALAGLLFLWGVFKFVSAAGDEKARSTGKQFIIWGLIGLTVMFAIWGLVNILIAFLGTGTGTAGLRIPRVTR